MSARASVRQPYRPGLESACQDLRTLTTDLGILAGGLLAALSPTVLSAGFETSTGGSWNAFAAEQRRLADFMLAGFRLVGALNVVLGFTLFAVAVMALREGARWAWWNATAIENGWQLVTKDEKLRDHRHPHSVTIW